MVSRQRPARLLKQPPQLMWRDSCKPLALSCYALPRQTARCFER
jgi:hypothetical protein